MLYALCFVRLASFRGALSGFLAGFWQPSKSGSHLGLSELVFGQAESPLKRVAIPHVCPAAAEAAQHRSPSQKIARSNGPLPFGSANRRRRNPSPVRGLARLKLALNGCEQSSSSSSSTISSSSRRESDPARCSARRLVELAANKKADAISSKQGGSSI